MNLQIGYNTYVIFEFSDPKTPYILHFPSSYYKFSLYFFWGDGSKSVPDNQTGKLKSGNKIGTLLTWISAVSPFPLNLSLLYLSESQKDYSITISIWEGFFMGGSTEPNEDPLEGIPTLLGLPSCNYIFTFSHNFVISRLHCLISKILRATVRM